jgi:hypothetical protein
MSEITKIIQCFLPTMVAGEYSVTIKQAILNENVDITQHAGPDKSGINKTLKFGVDAPRFTLNPSDIYSVYPPSGQFGKYSESLPHIVFTRRTLPWERTIDGNIRPEGFPPVPWMALILFNEDEMKLLKIDKSQIKNIIRENESDPPLPPATPGITRPEIYQPPIKKTPAEEESKPPLKTPTSRIELMDWEVGKNLENGCFSIDISKEQFETHIPSKKSLSYLAHAKEVSIKNKDKNGITDLNSENIGVFSVVVGNRSPDPGKQHTALLVSLEGYADYLSDAPKATKKTFPAGSKVRLVVLANWPFTDSGSSTFLDLVRGIEVKSMKIKREGEHKKLNDYFDLGYAPLKHLTRNSATTLSWYHGPFLPRQSPKMSKNISFSSSDAALRYDKKTGFFDISFAAAWQLGRMLALQNQCFSRAILNFRISQKQSEVEGKRKEAIGDILLKAGVVDIGKDMPLKGQVINFLSHLHNNTLDAEKGQMLFAAKANRPAHLPTDFPKEVTTFLGELCRLNGVPLGYLIPSEYFLEKQHTSFDKQLSDLNTKLQKLKQENRESDQDFKNLEDKQTNLLQKNTKHTGTLSLFYVDPNWIEALLDGALSIGRVPDTETLLDKAMSGEFDTFFDQKATEISSAGSTDKVEVKKLNMTGFLLRSDVVSGWRGVEIEARDAVGELLPALRFERLDSEILLGIFNGNVASVVITEPYEGLHFSIQSVDKFEKAFTKGIASRILDAAAVAGVMQEKPGATFTSADFALKMIERPVRYTIEVKIDNS